VTSQEEDRRNQSTLATFNSLHVQAVGQFAVQCQLAAGAFVPPTDSIRIATALHQALNVCAECFQRHADPRVAKIVIGLARQTLAAWASDNRPQKDSAGIAYARACDAITLIVQMHATPSLMLRDIARRNEVSPAYLCDVLQRYSGYGFLSHLRAIRVLNAAILLVTTEDSVGQIARKCGYPRTFQLARHFHATVGVSPSRLRRLIDT
jgi:AraC-like DNA-binding protein